MQNTQNTASTVLIAPGMVSLILFTGFLLIFGLFAVQITWPTGLSWIDRGVYLNRFFADFFLYCALVILVLRPALLSKLLACTIIVGFTLVYFVQTQSYITTGAFIPAVALENAEHADFLETDKLMYAGLIWGVFLLLLLRYANVWVNRFPSLPKRLFWVFALVIIAMMIKNDKYWLSKQTLENRFDFYNSGQPGIPRVSPLSEFVEILGEYAKYWHQQSRIANRPKELTERASVFAYEHFDFLGLENADYPLLHTTDFGSLTGLELKSVAEGAKKTKKNIIVIFAEGISAELIQPYSDRFPGISPNIADFADASLRVDNYYSHSYATYRGLGGQLCSLYPYGRLYPDNNYYCLPHALTDDGYQTRFMVSQRLDKTDLDLVFDKSGIERIDGSKAIASSLSMDDIENVNVLTDKQLINGLITQLKELEEQFDRKPFFVGLYNFQTHTGVRLIDKTVKYVSEKHKPNFMLDTFHNFDKVFGEFWNYFKTSKLYDNTIVVLTSDHATFPSRQMRRLMAGTNYSPVFAGKIPLIIYDPDIQDGTTFDAKGASSVNLAPSLMHLVGAEDRLVPFLGKSIFSAGNQFPNPLSSGGLAVFYQHDPDNNRWIHVKEAKKQKAEEYAPGSAAVFEFIEYLGSLERANRIWKPKD